MKTRLLTNKQRNSFRLDVINKGNYNTYYFKTKQEALEFQKKL